MRIRPIVESKMTRFEGYLHKMVTRLGPPIEYRLQNEHTELCLNECLGKNLQLIFNQSIHCIHCGRETRKSFNQGFCYPCFRSLARCDICIVSPEKCHYHLGSCREPDWGDQYCMQDHVIYLSNTSGVKVGITRHNQLPTRWIDQGAVQALAVLRVSSRYFSGLVETGFKTCLNDKTNWRSMLKNDYTEQDLQAVFEAVWPKVKAVLKPSVLKDISVVADSEPLKLQYPAIAYPKKIKSFNLDKNPQINDQLLAIKGQYLIFEHGVINIRKYAGYHVTIDC